MFFQPWSLSRHPYSSARVPACLGGIVRASVRTCRQLCAAALLSSLERDCGSLPAQPLPSALPRVSSCNLWPCRVTSQALLPTLFCSPTRTDRFQPGSKSFHSPKPSPSARRDCSAGARAVPETGGGQDPVCPQSFNLPLGPFSLGKKSFSFFKRKK